jgi:hypothetical protein
MVLSGLGLEADSRVRFEADIARAALDKDQAGMDDTLGQFRQRRIEMGLALPQSRQARIRFRNL